VNAPARRLQAVTSEADEDRVLLERHRAGDAQAFTGLVRRHERAIYLLALRYVGDGDEARDVAQRAFVQVYKQLQGFRGEASFRTWIYRIAANLALDALRKRGRDARLAEDAAQHPDATLGPERDRLAQMEERERLREAVRLLPPKQRLVVELRVFEELSFREVAEVADTSEDSAKVSFHHAVKRLKALLGEDADDGR
jgi:RNA polymerase sigma-70 factor (ECF subfamily)